MPGSAAIQRLCLQMDGFASHVKEMCPCNFVVTCMDLPALRSNQTCLGVEKSTGARGGDGGIAKQAPGLVQGSSILF